MDGLAYKRTMPYLCQNDDGRDSDAMAMSMDKCPVECAFSRAYWVVREYSPWPLPLGRVAVVSVRLSIWLVLVLRLQLLKRFVESTSLLFLVKTMFRTKRALDFLFKRTFSSPKIRFDLCRINPLALRTKHRPNYYTPYHVGMLLFFYCDAVFV